MAILELKDVSYHYKVDGLSVPVLSNINFSVEEGEFVAIMGPSGSGKSTLLYLMGGMLKMEGGQLIIDERDISNLNNEELAKLRNQKLGFIFQQFHLLSKANVIQNILLPTEYPCDHQLEMSKKNLLRAKDLANSFGLGDRLDHLPNQLSGGQQQRVAIARALINDPRIILADEPTGNLDSKTSEQIMELLKDLNRQGKTIIIITHDPEVAKRCSRVIHIKDGAVTEIEKLSERTSVQNYIGQKATSQSKSNGSSYFKLIKSLFPLALENMNRNKGRTTLTMLGITIGIAAVLSMVTLGQFTKRKILDSYAEMGVNTLMFFGYPNWELKATDIVPVMFRFFDWERDLIPLKRIFPEIAFMSPLLRTWEGSIHFSGKSVDSEVRVLGVNNDALAVSNRELLVGTNFSPFHIEKRSPVCIIGYEIGERLFSQIAPIGQVAYVVQGENSFGCKIIGILKSATSNKEWMKPNLQIYLPFTYFQATTKEWYQSQIKEVLIQVKPNSDIEKVGKSIRAYFEMKYGSSGRFRVDSDSVLIAQMSKFLNLFTIMLGAIALISLAVGGIGITNMMLVSVSERFREIGLRKALGATDKSIRIQFLMESIFICAFAGSLGILIGFTSYHSIIWGISKLVSKLQFEWVLDWGALLLSLVSLALVGILSGFFPALKAERLQVIEALRSE